MAHPQQPARRPPLPAVRRSGAAPGPATLAALLAAVLLAHALALRGRPPPSRPAPRPPAWQVRLTEAPTPSARPVVVATPLPPLPRQPSRAAGPQRARPATPTPAAAGAGREPATDAPQPAAVTDTADASTPADPAPAVAPALALPAPRLPPPATWRYAVTQRWRGQLLAGTGTLDWQPAGEGYAATLAWSVPPLPPRTLASTGVLGRDGLQPRRFGLRARGEFATHVDAAGARVVFSSNRPDAPLAEGLQDRASVLLQLAGWLAADPARWTMGQRLQVAVAGSHEVTAGAFVVEGTEALDLPGGRLEALRLVRAPAHPWDLRWEAWFAPGAAYAPVRLRLTTPAGDATDLQWSGTDSR
jgi:hypothetical protein